MSLMVIAVSGQKGGAGKTTVATNLVPELILRGRRVLLVDADMQGSARTWADHAAQAKLPAPAVAVIPGIFRFDEQAIATWLLRDLPTMVADFDDVVIDCPGFLNGRHSVPSAALSVSDIAIIPSAEDAFSAWSLAATADLIRGVQRARPQLLAFGLVEGVDLRRKIGEQVRDHIANARLPALRSQMLDRAEYVEACGFLMGASTYRPRSEAAKEVRALVDELQMIWRLHGQEVTQRTTRKTSRREILGSGGRV
jgi:chromosome partitioning protein